MNNYELSPWVTRRLQKYRNACLCRSQYVDPIKEAFKVAKLIRKEAEIALKLQNATETQDSSWDVQSPEPSPLR